MLNVTGGSVVLSPTSKIAGLGTVNQTGGTLDLQLTSSTLAGTFPTVSAGAINLNGTLLASLQGSVAGLGNSTVFKDVFVSGSAISNTEKVTSNIPFLFNVSLVPDAVTADALDLSVALSPSGEARTAQVLAQALRFGLVGQQNVIDTIENRLQVGRNEQGPGLQFASLHGDRLAVSDADQQAQVPAGGTGLGAAAWGRAYAFDWNGTTLTPYVNLDYIHQSLGAFAETGSLGALSVTATNGNSLSTTVGLRASTSIDLGSHGTLVPEVRAGWAHEFMDASQTLTAQLVATAASPFTVVGTQFGRDSAVVGVGVSHEFAPGASFFMDYDGQFTGGFNQNSGSVGIKVKF